MRFSTCCPRDGMLRRSRGEIRAFVALAVITLTLPGLAGDADDGLRDLARRAGQKDALIRIGFDAAERVEVGATSGGFRLVDPASGTDIWRAKYRDPIAILPEGEGAGGAVERVYRIQAGAYGAESAAQSERDRLQKTFGVPAVVHYVPDRGSWRVRIGESPDREGLATLLEAMRTAGMEGLWIAEEPRQAATGITVRLVDMRTYESKVTELSRVAAIPAGKGAVEIDGEPFRGVVEIRVTPYGTVRPINWLNFELYLLGVVPAELGPAVWPQLEALKAQAVAARTYAWRNLGQFEDDGFDLCRGPRCQAYNGKGGEHPLSDRAVRETRQQIVTWQGKPATTMYTATCGGHTEDAGLIFPEETAPYLVGVPCRAEGKALAEQVRVVTGDAVAALRDETGRDATRDWALLRAAGVLENEDSVARMAGAVQPDDIRRWATALARVSGRVAPAVDIPPIADLGAAAAALLDAVGWDERARVLVTATDEPALIRDRDAAALDDRGRRAIAYLAKMDALPGFTDGSFRVRTVPSRARMLPALVRVAETYDALGLRQATLTAVRGEDLRLFRGTARITRRMADSRYLVGLASGKPAVTDRLELWPGDRVGYRAGSGGRIDYLELRPPIRGVSDDRLSKRFAWEERRTRRELERSINRRVDIGTLRDLRVLKRGVSGRIVELEVVGSKASTTIRGFDIRRALGLLESLVVFEIQRDPDGRVTSIVFAGKGWGHGVGMCQVGAYGMALRGATYREILAHYYTGSRLERIGPN